MGRLGARKKLEKKNQKGSKGPMKVNESFAQIHKKEQKKFTRRNKRKTCVFSAKNLDTTRKTA